MIDVAFTRRDVQPTEIAVVIDVLRATSTISSALAGGYRAVLIAETVERARELRAPGRVLAGEQHCLRPAGFDQGNSPAEAETCRGHELVLATTNGAPTAIVAAKRAATVMLGGLTNLDAVIAALLGRVDPAASTIQLVCSGTNGRPAVEDVYAAGRMSTRLPGPRTDAALIAEAVARGFRDPESALAASDDAQLLVESGMAPDIGHCAEVSRLDCVPVVLAAGRQIAIAVDATAPDPIRLDDLGDELRAVLFGPGIHPDAAVIA